MEDIISNRGLDLIAVNIFNYLDSTDLSNCMEVSISWNDCITRNRTIWVKQLKLIRLRRHAVYIHGSKSVLKNICLHFEKHEESHNIKRLVKFLKSPGIRLSRGDSQFQKALLNARFIWRAYPKAILEPIDSGSSTILYHAFMDGKSNVVKFYLDTLKQNNVDGYELLLQLLFQLQESKGIDESVEILCKFKAPYYTNYIKKFGMQDFYRYIKRAKDCQDDIDKILTLFQNYLKGNE